MYPSIMLLLHDWEANQFDGDGTGPTAERTNAEAGNSTLPNLKSAIMALLYLCTFTSLLLCLYFSFNSLCTAIVIT